jgi:hypothetical protein
MFGATDKAGDLTKAASTNAYTNATAALQKVWMDTPCIPSDHKLRQEAIGRINDIFETSKLTIACDRDLMEIDISEPSIEMYEQLLATILLCDWNVRAWT